MEKSLSLKVKNFISLCEISNTLELLFYIEIIDDYDLIMILSSYQIWISQMKMQV